MYVNKICSSESKLTIDCNKNINYFMSIKFIYVVLLLSWIVVVSETCMENI